MRVFFVTLLGLYVIAGTLPGLSLIWNTHDVSWGLQGPLGFSTDYDGVIKAVDPNSPAMAAGLAAGERIDLARTPARDRYYIDASPADIPAGQLVNFYVVAGSNERTLSLVAPHQRFAPVPAFNLIARSFAAFVFVIVGGLLLLLRPSRMTWGFYFYCLGFNPGIAFSALSRHPSFSAHLSYLLTADVLTAAGTVGIFVFALEFLRHNPSTWRQIAEHLVPYLFLLFVGLICYPDIANNALGMRAERVQEVMLTLQGAMFGMSILIVLDTYIRGRAEDRERIQFVVIGLIIGVLGTYAGALLLFSSILPFTPPHWMGSLLLLLNVTLPLTVAYAIIRHRVFDLSFVVSRAIIYGILTFLLGSVFALISWFIGQELEATNLARIVEIVAAIAFSFWLNDLQAKVSSFADGIFFRQRRAAMLRLARAAAALPHAEQLETIDTYLVQEPVDALELSAAALFRQSDDGDFRRVKAVGWPEQPLMLAHDDALVLNLQAQQDLLRPAEIGWRCEHLEARTYPVLAVPLVLRRQLVGFALYSAHKNGADIDPDEARGLQQLATSAESSYDHLRAEALDKEVASLKAQAEQAIQLKAELTTLQQALDPERGTPSPAVPPLTLPSP